MNANRGSCSNTPFARRSENAWIEILKIKQRYFFVTAFVAELEIVSRGKEFRIAHDILWTMLLDSRDMLVINLGSWCKAAHSQGGLFAQIRAHHLGDFPRRRRTNGGLLEDEHQAAFRRLFPGVETANPKPQDIDVLKNRFESKTAPVRQDRDNNRAHPWERGHGGNVKMLDLTELREMFGYIESVLNDLALVGCESSAESRELTNIATPVAATDIVDQILLGTLPWIKEVGLLNNRTEFYDAMHERHAAAAKGYFNDHDRLT